MSTSASVKAQLSALISSANSVTGADDTDLTGAVDSLIDGYGSVDVEPNEVNFYDFDGTLLYSYTVAQARALTALPPLPVHAGLENDGWNHTLAEVNALTHIADIGCTYMTSDGKTRAYISVKPEHNSMLARFAFTQSAANGVTVDWGDGTQPETYANASSKGSVIASHTYQECGDYVVSFMPGSSVTMKLGISDKLISGAGDVHFSCYATSANAVTFKVLSHVTKIELGVRTSFEKGALSGSHKLRSISIPNGTSTYGAYCFAYCENLYAIILPRSFTTSNDHMFYQTNHAYVLSLPPTFTTTGSYVVSYCSGISRLTLPDNITALAQDFIGNSAQLSEIHLPESLTKFNNYLFQNMYSLISLKMPAGVTSVGSSILSGCYMLSNVDFTRASAIPSLSNSNIFENASSNLVVRVPVNLYDSWRRATNWARHASKLAPYANGAPVTLSSIAVTTMPDTTAYTVGDTFVRTGMTVEAAYSNGSKFDVSDYSVSPSALSAGDTAVTISYTVRGVTATATVAVTVSEGGEPDAE